MQQFCGFKWHNGQNSFVIVPYFFSLLRFYCAQTSKMKTRRYYVVDFQSLYISIR